MNTKRFWSTAVLLLPRLLEMEGLASGRVAGAEGPRGTAMVCAGAVCGVALLHHSHPGH
jgi:hypothetical protein